MNWWHFEVKHSGKCSVRDESSGERFECSYQMGHLTTGKNRVHWGRQILVSTPKGDIVGKSQGDTGSYRPPLIECNRLMGEAGYSLLVAGNTPGYSESALSGPSGQGYPSGRLNPVSIMGAIMKEASADLETLTCSNLESYLDFLRNEDHSRKAGVYIWGFCFHDLKSGKADSFLPYYVGKHRSDIRARVQHHIYRDLRAGNHKILKQELLLGKKPWRYFGSQSPDDHIYIYKDKGKIIGPKEGLPSDAAAVLARHINTYTDNLYVSCIVVPSYINDANDFVDRLEGHVQNLIEKFYREIKDPDYTPPEKYFLASKQGRRFKGNGPKILPQKGTEHIF